MKKIVLGLLIAAAFNNNGAFAGPGTDENDFFVKRGNVHTFNPNRLNVKNQNDGLEFDQGSMTKSQTITLTETKEEVQQPEGNVYKDTFLTAAQWGATAAGLGLTYLYGPTALFWGTYNVAGWALGKMGIAGITGISAATKAALLVADSQAAQTALTIAGGYVGKYGVTAAIKTAEVALTGATYAAKGAWSLGSYAYNSFWGSAPVVKEEKKVLSKEEMRANTLRAVEQRLNVGKNLASPKVQRVLGVAN